ncbi:MAG: acyl--CoA ligase [Coprobacillus sp.]|nr:acyl--CoA ligase [Coprobacillus sp.]
MFEDMSMYEAFKWGYHHNPKEAAITYEGRNISFTKLHSLINKYAAILKNELGIKKGDVVLMAIPNIPQEIIFLYAVNKIGAIANLVHPSTPYNQLKGIIEKTEVKIAILFEQSVAKEADKFKEIKDMIYIVQAEDFLGPIKKFFYHTFMNRKVRKKLVKSKDFEGFKFVKDLKTKVPYCETETGLCHECACILHSGSTTGDPKIILMSNDNLNFMASHASEFLGVDLANTKHYGMLSVLPGFHSFGLLWTIHAPLSWGFASIQVPDFTPKNVVKAIKHYPTLAFTGVPNMYIKCLNYKPFRKCKALKYCYTAWCGGDVINPEIEQDFNDVLAKNGSKGGKIFEGYGLTETCAAVVVNTHDHYCPGSIGYPASEVETKVVDEDRNVVPYGEIGELAIRSRGNMIGYYKDEKATKETVDEEGWLYTGDLVTQNEEGYIFFKQRKKRVVKVSGVMVFPSEVEKYIETIPGVKEACAVSVPFAKTGSALKVFVNAKYTDADKMKETIMEGCRNNLIKWAVPVEIEFRKNMPHTMIGKIDFKILQQEEDKKYGVKTL